jgi:excinuclease UvrABC nuclease subunit
MKNKSDQENSEFSFTEQRLYPHLKITNEKFPRLLVTRKIENDGAEYFGAFLPNANEKVRLRILQKFARSEK